MNSKEIVLSAKDVTMRFGGLCAVDTLNLDINAGELVGLIGPNGAGKTTAFNCLTGVYTPTSGSVKVRGVPIGRLRPWQICQLGVARTFQNIRLFKNLSVLDNVVVASLSRTSLTWTSTLLRTPAFFREKKRLETRASEILRVFDLQGSADLPARTLPYGLQRKLEIVRALATDPRLLLLDEPAAGLNARETEDLMNTISRIRKDFRLSILLIEHDMKLVMGICERILVLDHGATIAHGTPTAVRSNSHVIEAYLGAPQA